MTLTFDDARARAERAVEAGSDAKHRSRRGASRRARLLAASVHGTAHELRATLELALWPDEPGTQTTRLTSEVDRAEAEAALEAMFARRDAAAQADGSRFDTLVTGR